MRLLTSFFLILSLPFLSFAQKNRNFNYFDWKIGFHSTHFLSDLGGKDGDGTNDIRDLNLNQTRFAVAAGLNYHFGAYLSFGLNVTGGTLAASDFQTKSSRLYRQIQVRTQILETVSRLQMTVPDNVKYWEKFFINLGGGLLFFNPQGYYNGTWHNLRPLGTEGQNINPDLEQYGIFTPVLTLGFGRNFDLPDGFRLSVEVNLRKSFSDYLDDTSTDYADAESIRLTDGEVAAHFSNPSEYGQDVIGIPGSLRANPDNNDNYFFIGISISKIIGGITRTSKYRKPRKKYNWLKGDQVIPRNR